MRVPSHPQRKPRLKLYGVNAPGMESDTFSSLDSSENTIDDNSIEDEEEMLNILKRIKGHLVLFPLYFLEGESLYPQITDASAYVDTELFQ